MGKPFDEFWYVSTHHRPTWSLNNKFAGPNHSTHNGSSIEVSPHFNGSGPQAFGGANSWPHVRADVSLPVGKEELAQELALRLRETIAEFLFNHDLLEENNSEGG
jgi:hypothetical protein